MAAEVWYATSLEHLESCTSTCKVVAPGGSDTAQVAVLEGLYKDKTYYYQLHYRVVEDSSKGESEVGTLEAKSGLNAWDEGDEAHTINLLVRLDADPDTPGFDGSREQQLADIAAGIQVFAERLHDAFDGVVRLGTVLVTDKEDSGCSTGGSTGDVRVQATTPAGHGRVALAIERGCGTIEIGRDVSPLENDLHFGYTLAHLFMHYAFGAADLHRSASPGADCRNGAWDGSLMHDSGGWDGQRWRLTEVDRSMDVTPCQHGVEPWTWDLVRGQGYRLPERPEGGPPKPDLGEDAKARGNPDGGELRVHVLAHASDSSTLTTFNPDGSNPRCGSGSPPVVDRADDARGGGDIDSAEDTETLRSHRALDILSGYLKWNPVDEAVTFHIRVADLSRPSGLPTPLSPFPIGDRPPPEGTGLYFRFYFTLGGDRYQVTAALDHAGNQRPDLAKGVDRSAERRTLRSEWETILRHNLRGGFDPLLDEITVVLPASSFRAGVITQGAVFSGLKVYAQRLVGPLTLTADIGRAWCDYRIGEEANLSPVAADDSATTREGEPVDLLPLLNDSDPDGDALSIQQLEQPRYGIARLNPAGTVTYIPKESFFGEDSFRYTVRDGRGAASSATVTIDVQPVPDPPVASNDRARTARGEPVTVFVLENDHDPDGDDLRVASVGRPRWGSATITHDQQAVIYSPGPHFASCDTFEYSVSDTTGLSATATVTVLHHDFEVGEGLGAPPCEGYVNDPPEALADSAVTRVGQVVTIDVLGNDHDPDGDDLVISDVGEASGGTATIEAAGTLVSYRPNAGFAGIDSFSYRVGDGLGGSAEASVTVRVIAPPVAGQDDDVTLEDQAVTIAVLSNDSGDELQVTSATQPLHGSVAVNADGTVTYMPNLNFHGNDRFQYTVTDSLGDSASADVVIAVLSVNDAPDAVDDTATTKKNKAVTIDVVANDSDPDGDLLQVVSVGRAANGSVKLYPDGSIRYRPKNHFVGTDSFTYTISDGKGGVDTAGVTVVVAAD